MEITQTWIYTWKKAMLDQLIILYFSTSEYFTEHQEGKKESNISVISELCSQLHEITGPDISLRQNSGHSFPAHFNHLIFIIIYGRNFSPGL